MVADRVYQKNRGVKAAVASYGSRSSRYVVVQGYPILIFLDSNGDVIETQFGMTTASKVMDMAKRVVQANEALVQNTEMTF